MSLALAVPGPPFSAVTPHSAHISPFTPAFVDAPKHMKFLSRNCNLHHSCGSLTHGAGTGMEPAFGCCRDAANPAGPQQELPYHIFFFFLNGHGVQWLEIGSQFPEQGWNLGHSGESMESYPLNHQGTPTHHVLRRSAMANLPKIARLPPIHACIPVSPPNTLL